MEDDALTTELLRIQEAAKCAAQSQFESSKLWHSAHLALGGAAAVLAAIAGAAGLTAVVGATTSSLLALAAAGLGAITTTLNAGSRADRAHAAANAYLAVQTEARQVRELDAPTTSVEDVREQIAALTQRQQEINATADLPSRFSYRRGQRNLKDGQQTYEVDR